LFFAFDNPRIMSPEVRAEQPFRVEWAAIKVPSRRACTAFFECHSGVDGTCFGDPKAADPRRPKAGF
jgi:hypothetical protein